MQDKLAIKNDGYCDFIELFKLEDLENPLIGRIEPKLMEEIRRYYFACIKDQHSPRLLEPLALLSQRLDQAGVRLLFSGFGEASTEERSKALNVIRERITDHEKRARLS